MLYSTLLLIHYVLQEKHREKKHKKEKKDKEKREGKEKREKDRSDEKHREKKEKKEKQKDKKKDKEKDKEKDRDKSKDRSGTLDEKILSGQAESRGGEKLVQKEGKDKDKGNSVDKRFPGQFAGYKAEKPSQKSYLDEGNKDSKLVQELGRRIKDEAKGIGNQFENFSSSDPKNDEGMVRLVAKGTGSLAEVKEKNKDRRVEDKTMVDGQRIRDEAKVSGNAMVQNAAGNIPANFGAMPKLLDKNVDRKMEGQEKAKDKRGEDKRGDKRKDKEKEKKSQKKDKNRDKEKKKEEKAKEKIQIKNAEKIQLQNTEKIQLQNTQKIPLQNIEKIQSKNIEPDNLRESNKDDLVGFNSIKTSQLSKDSNKIAAAAEGNLKKRKDLETNGVLHGEFLCMKSRMTITDQTNLSIYGFLLLAVFIIYQDFWWFCFYSRSLNASFPNQMCQQV